MVSFINSLINHLFTHLFISFTFYVFFMFIVATLVILLLRSAGLSQGNAFGVVLDFTGGVAGSCTCFILPALCYLKLMSRNDTYYYASIVMLIFGIIIAIDVPVLSVLYAIGYVS